MKLRRMPRLHSRLLLRQLLQSGTRSSHLRWRSRQVRHPVRTRLDLPGTGLARVAGLGPELLPPLRLRAALTGAAGGGVTREAGCSSWTNRWLVPTGNATGVPCRLTGEAPYWAPVL